MSQSITLVLALLAAGVFFAATLALGYLYISTKLSISREVQLQINLWAETERETVRRQQQQLADEQARVQLDRWKATYTTQIRQEAIKQSQAVTVGKVTEHIVPYLPDFPFNPKDVRFLGSPIDLIVFNGLSNGELKDIVFVEIKTNTSTLTGRERNVRDAVTDRRVRWLEFRQQKAMAVEIGRVQ